MKILPFDFDEVCRYFPRYSAEEQALQIDDQLSVAENIQNTFLDPMSVLFEEPENLLKQEVREPALYNSILSIANVASCLSEISSRMGEKTNVCSVYLKNLLGLGLIQKETPYGDPASRKAIYAINDNLFRFWYRFVPQNSSIISRGATKLALERIEPYLSEYISNV